jgi:hypothetical protein
MSATQRTWYDPAANKPSIQQTLDRPHVCGCCTPAGPAASQVVVLNRHIHCSIATASPSCSPSCDTLATTRAAVALPVTSFDTVLRVASIRGQSTVTLVESVLNNPWPSVMVTVTRNVPGDVNVCENGVAHNRCSRTACRFSLNSTVRLRQNRAQLAFTPSAHSRGTTDHVAAAIPASSLESFADAVNVVRGIVTELDDHDHDSVGATFLRMRTVAFMGGSCGAEGNTVHCREYHPTAEMPATDTLAVYAARATPFNDVAVVTSVGCGAFGGRDSHVHSDARMLMMCRELVAVPLMIAAVTFGYSTRSPPALMTVVSWMNVRCTVNPPSESVAFTRNL